MQDEAAVECGPEFQEELLVLQSIYDSELQMKRNMEGGISLQLKLCPSPPTYIRASVTVHIPTAVRAPGSARFTVEDLLWPQRSHAACRINPQLFRLQNVTYSVCIPRI